MVFEPSLIMSVKCYYLKIAGREASHSKDTFFYMEGVTKILALTKRSGRFWISTVFLNIICLEV